MRPNYLSYLLFLVVALLVSLSFVFLEREKPALTTETEVMKKSDSVLRHVVLFKFKEGTPSEKIREIQEAFGALPSKIPQIISYEWGTNNSPEGLEKGFTHCFFLTFNSEEDRAIYLPHPDHKAFGDLLSGHLEDVLVVDYWSR